VHVLFCAVLCLLALAAFYQVVDVDFSPFDDDIAIIDNVHVHSFTGENLHWMFTDTALTLRYAPLRYVVWTLVWVMTGPGPRGFHALALLTHLLNVVLVYWLAVEVISRMLRGRGRAVTLAVPICAAVGTALWAVHPLRVEVLSWAMMAEYAQAQAFAIVALLFYFRAAERGGVVWRIGWYWGAVAMYLVSLLFYPSTIGLPLVLPVLDVWLFGRGRFEVRNLARLFLEKVPCFVVALGLGMLTLLGRAASATTIWGAAADLRTFGPFARIAQVAFVFCYYLWKPLNPTRLAPYYTWLIGFDPWGPVFLLSILALVVISILAWVWREKYPWLLVVWVAHVAAVLPVGGYFEETYIPADRYAYFQDVVLGVAIACGLAWMWPRMTKVVRGAALAAACAVVLTFVALSQGQVLTWSNGESVYLNVFRELGTHPYRQKVYWRLADWYLGQRRPADALEWVNKSLELEPDDPAAWHIKARALVALVLEESAARGDTPEVKARAREALGLVERLLAIRDDEELRQWAGILYRHAGGATSATGAGTQKRE
jgi:hypothetical protein